MSGSNASPVTPEKAIEPIEVPAPVTLSIVTSSSVYRAEPYSVSVSGSKARPLTPVTPDRFRDPEFRRHA